MVSAGPRPGSTPMAVPSVVPTRHHKRLVGVKATAKPLAREAKVSIAQLPAPMIELMPEFSTFSMKPAPMLTPSARAKPK